MPVITDTSLVFLIIRFYSFLMRLKSWMNFGKLVNGLKLYTKLYVWLACGILCEPVWSGIFFFGGGEGVGRIGVEGL